MYHLLFPHKDGIIKKIVVLFYIEPEYFFEYRLRKHVEILEKNLSFLINVKNYYKDLKQISLLNNNTPLPYLF